MANASHVAFCEAFRAICRCLTRIAHEPTVGLYFVVRHIRTRVVTVFDAADRAADKIIDGVAETTRDVNFTIDAIRDYDHLEERVGILCQRVRGAVQAGQAILEARGADMVRPY